jgi:hypothetical protein
MKVEPGKIGQEATGDERMWRPPLEVLSGEQVFIPAKLGSAQ